MEIQASRSKSSRGPSGEPVLLLDQNRGLWDQLLIRRGLAALERAEAGWHVGPICAASRDRRLSRPARTPEETDWAQIAALYDALARLAPSPVVELNRAVAFGMAFGPAAGLELVDALHRNRRSRATICCRAFAAISSKTRPLRRGACGVRARGIAHAQYTRTRSAPRARGPLLRIRQQL